MDIGSIVRDEISKFPSMSQSYMFFYDQAMGFYHAVSWSKEKWLQALLAGHVVTLLLIIFGQRFRTLQMIIFLTGCFLIFMSEQLNTIGREHWKDFSTQNYFDTHGVFMSVVFSAPILINITIQLLVTLAVASNLVVKVKRHELGIERRKKDE